MSRCSRKAGVSEPLKSGSVTSTIHQFPSGGRQETGKNALCILLGLHSETCGMFSAHRLDPAVSEITGSNRQIFLVREIYTYTLYSVLT